MRRILLFLLLIFSFVTATRAQYIKIGESNYLGSAGGPLINSTNLASYGSRFAYIFPASVLGNMKHGDTITSLEFTREAGLTLNSNCYLKIYLRNTTLTDYGAANLIWSSRTNGATLVYDQNPAAEITTSEGFQKIPFYNGNFFYDTTKGKNLELLVEYFQTSTQAARIYWYYENASTVSGYAAYQGKYFFGTALNDTLKTSTDNHPTIIFNYPRFDNDIALIKLYTLGKLPVPLGNPDSVKAMVRNVGKKAQGNVKLKTWSKGYNNQQDSAVFSIGKEAQIFINVPSLNPAKKGLDTIYASIYSDQNASNDTAKSYRLANENIYSYRDVTQPSAPGGIGFNGQTGDFVGRFYSNKSKSINQVTVEFALAGRAFKVGIWESKSYGEGPGKLIYISDSLTTTAGKYILNLKKPVSVNGTFFVGVRQLNGNNVAFGYQIEDIVRPNTFYYTSPAADTNWYDFHPDIPFRFLMEPRLQGDTDLTALSADYPKDTLDKYNIGTLAPQGTVLNLGAKDLLDSFDIICEILFSGKTVYKELIRDTLSSGIKRSYTFPKTFDPKNFGEHQLRLIVSNKNDQIRDNDTAIRKFYVGVKNDVMIATVYEPANNSIFEYLIDTIQPAATVQNPSYNDISNITARCLITKGNTVLYNKTQTLSLPKFNSKILVWPTYKCLDTGRLKIFYIVEYSKDVLRSNDTQSRNFMVIKSYDAGVDSVALPDKNKFYTEGIGFKPIFRTYNDGSLDAGDVEARVYIYSNYTSYTYRDTVKFDIDAKSQFIAQCGRQFKPYKKGIYYIFIQLIYPLDNVKWNDTLRMKFNVGYPYDYLSKQIIYPKSSDTLSVGNGPYQVKTRIKNNGFVKNTDLVPVICQVWRNGIKVYQDIKSLNLDTGLQFDLDFTKNFNPLNAGLHKVVLFTNYVSDINRNNDTITSDFWVKIGKDAYVQRTDTPWSSVTYDARKSVIPFKVTIANAGNLKMAQVRIYNEIYYKGSRVFFDKTDDSLLAFQNKLISFPKTFIPNDSGIYQWLTYTYAADDQNIFNDSLISFFRVGKNKDVALKLWLEPLPGSTYTQGQGSMKPAVMASGAGTDTSISVNGWVEYIVNQYGGPEIFRDSGIFNSLRMGSSVNVYASKSWPYTVPGTYIITAIAHGGDMFPENDTLRSAYEIRVNGIQVISNSVIRVYPNPASTFLKVQIPESYKSSLFISDLTGKKYELKWLETGDIDLRELSAGVYILGVSGIDIPAVFFIKSAE